MELQEACIFVIDSGIGLCAMWVPSWNPSWGHVGDFFSQKWAGLWHAPALFVAMALFFPYFLTLLATSWALFGVHVARFSASFGINFGRHLGLSWAAFPSQAPTQTPNFLIDPFAVALPLVVRVVAGTRLAALKIKNKKNIQKMIHETKSNSGELRHSFF